MTRWGKFVRVGMGEEEEVEAETGIVETRGASLAVVDVGPIYAPIP